MCENTVPEIKSYSKINSDFKEVTHKEEVKFPYIRLYYGPVDRNGIIKHKPQKLHGLIACLRKMKYNVEVIPAAHLNVLKIVILGHEIVRMNLKFLQFNIDCSFDSLCPKILKQVEEAIDRLYSNENIAKEISIWIDDLNQDLSMDNDDSYDDLIAESDNP